ncbi:RNA-binding domain-containing protein [Meredithblackwellia eburnea MCA 4105]
MASSSAERTRLILTTLPPTLTPQLLREHLAQCPPSAPILTDLKLLTKPDGTSRRIAFVGFKLEKEAKRVLDWVKGSWVDGANGRGGGRVGADWAVEAKDAPRPRKRSRFDPPSSDATLTTSPPSASGKPSTSRSNKDEASRFAEFMAVMGKRKGTALEQLPDESVAPVTREQPPHISVEQGSKKGEEDSQKKRKRKDEEEKEEDVFQVISAEKQEEREPTPERDAMVDNEEISDMEYMARRMKRMVEVEPEELEDADIEKMDAEDTEESTSSGVKDKNWVQEGEDGEPSNEDEKAVQSPRLDDPAVLLEESPRLFVRNLAFATNEQDLRELFAPFGELDNIHIPIDQQKKLPKGLAYVSFSSSASALAALNALDQRSFQGRLLHILPAVSRNPTKRDLAQSNGDRSLKQSKLDGLKTESGTGLNWATLYMNSDAVMTSVAERLNIPKAELLDPTNGNAAVKVALAETHVITETKQYFENEGVNLASLTTRGPRSQTTVLVKNIPYNTTSSTISALFSPFGDVSRILLPPAGTMAIVEMLDKEAAGQAWRGLVYKKIGSSILYLEKAPAGIWEGERKKPPAATQDAAATTESKTADGTKATNATDAGEPGSTLFIKNISFNTTLPALAAAFSSLPQYLSSRIQTKPDPKKPGGTLSMGFGFVVFRTVDAARDAMRVRDKYRLDGHALEVKFANRGKEDDSEGAKKSKAGEQGKKNSTSTKLLVKNVPFEVTRKELRELFSAYGQLTSVRVPRKMDHKTRGFAFLDFATRRDAEAAFSALEHTHVLGRHLVLQWADEGEGEVDKLREKAKAFSKAGPGGKKQKFKFGDGEPTAPGVGDDD